MAKTKYLTKALRCPDGSRKYIRGKTQKELDEKVRQAQMELGMGINIADSTTFSELAQTWLDLCKRPKVKASTAQLILMNMNKHVIPYIGHLRVRDIRPAHIANVMANASNLAKGTQANILVRVKEVFQFAIDNRIIAASPVTSQFKPGGSGPAERVPLTDEQVAELLTAAEKAGNDVYAFVMLCLFAGLRRGEALGLCWDCVDFVSRTITVKRQAVCVDDRFTVVDDLKSENAARVIPIPVFLVEYLRSRKSTSSTMTVVGTVGVKSVRGLSWKLYGLCRVDRNGHVKKRDGGVLDFYVHPHLLRHTYASKMLESGADLKEVQYLLGHATPSLALTVYTHYNMKSRQQSTAKKVDTAFRGITIPKSAQTG